MEKSEPVFLYIILLAWTILLLVGSVSAAEIEFVDAAYIGNGTLTITYPNDTLVSILHSSDTQEIQNGTAYVFEYQPSGLIKLEQEAGAGGTFPILEFLIAYFSNTVHLIIFFVLVVCLVIAVIL